MISDKRILKVIEGLTMGELHPKDDNWKSMIDDVYKFAHLGSQCSCNHPSWEQDFLKCEQELINAGIIGKIEEPRNEPKPPPNPIKRPPVLSL